MSKDEFFPLSSLFARSSPKLTLFPCFFSFPNFPPQTMSSLKLQRRLAASVLGVGKRALWLDPTETAEIALANSREFSFPSSLIASLCREPAPGRGGVGGGCLMTMPASLLPLAALASLRNCLLSSDRVDDYSFEAGNRREKQCSARRWDEENRSSRQGVPSIARATTKTDASCFFAPCNCPSFRSLPRPRGAFATHAATGNGSCHLSRVPSREESADPGPV